MRLTEAMAAVLLAWSVLAGAHPARADRASVFLVSDVAVDAKAENATDARDKALAEGHRLAFRRLIARLVPLEAARTVPKLDPAAIASLVQSFEVGDEKTSRVRYLARLTFRFDRAALRRFLRGRGVPFTATASGPVLVLPVLRSAGTHLLWDRPNPWREAWVGLPRAGELVPLLSPAGDLQDIRDISARQATSSDPTRLRAIAKRYGAASVAVMVASRHRAGAAPPGIRVSVTSHGAEQDKRTFVESHPVDPSVSMDENFRIAASRIARRIQESWKSGNLLVFDREGEVDAVVRVSGLDEWVAISRALSDTPSSDGTQVLSLSRHAVRVRLRYFGDADGFQAALRRNDLYLSLGDEGWMLSRGGDGAGSAR